MPFWSGDVGDFRGISENSMISANSRILPVTLKCVKDSFSRKGLLFAKRTFIFCVKDFYFF